MVDKPPHYTYTWIGSDRKLARRVAQPVQRFLAIETSSALLLFVSTICALVWANSPWKDSYTHLWEKPVGFILNNYSFTLSLHGWVNDGLMALFFFVVGIEIKREFLRGELRDRKAATLPILCAIGGVAFPALIYFLITRGTPVEHGWGIPMATDIAFAVAIIVALGTRIPSSIKVFLLALAIVDDLLAILVIAIFYSSGIKPLWLCAAGITIICVLLFRKVHIWWGPLYIVLGCALWFFLHEAGIHATLAGVIMGFATPLVPLIATRKRQEIITELDYLVADNPLEDSNVPEEQEVTSAQIHSGTFLLRETVPLGDRLIDRLHPWTSFVIIPLFALANAGIPLSGNGFSQALKEPVFWGIVLGLLVGKTFGISMTAWLATKTNIAQLPSGSTMKHMIGTAITAGAGFTVSLFITELAFTGESASYYTTEAKLGVLCASALAMVFGYYFLRTKN